MSASKLLDQVRITARLRHLSLRTEKGYFQHIKRNAESVGEFQPRVCFKPWDLVDGD